MAVSRAVQWVLRKADLKAGEWVANWVVWAEMKAATRADQKAACSAVKWAVQMVEQMAAARAAQMVDLWAAPRA